MLASQALGLTLLSSGLCEIIPGPRVNTSNGTVKAEYREIRLDPVRSY